MAAWRRAIELSLGDADVEKLRSIAQSRTEPASRVERSRILLGYWKDSSFFAVGHVWTAPALQEESDFSAKRSGAVMYPACFRLEDCLHRDAAALAAGPDVIR
jgi:hypothetical protein